MADEKRWDEDVPRDPKVTNKLVSDLMDRLMEVLEELRNTVPPDHPYARTRRYQLQAEIEDIESLTWDGARTDDPPDNWK